MLYKKRTYEDRPVTSVTTDGLPAMKMQRLDGRTNIVPPKGRVATLTRIQGNTIHILLTCFFKFVYFLWCFVFTKFLNFIAIFFRRSKTSNLMDGRP